VVALRPLGYKVAEDDHGVLFDEVVPATPAAAAGLENTDLITAINAKPVLSASALTSALHALRPGQTVKVTVLRPTGPNCTLTSQLLTVTLGATPKEGTRPAEPNVAFLGIAGPTTNATYTLPLGVSVDVGDIGGPSAGLSLTLGLLDILSNGHLTGGHKVAATGTIDVNGNVGDVGGVAQKTVAVRRAGAVLFLVPPQEYQVALKEAGAHMKVEAVSTLQQALDDLRAIGGQIPSTTVRAATNG
jgi:PDZ domain-containing protein